MPFVCDGVIAGCPQSCAADAACSIDNYCANGACLPRELKGSACASSSECRSGACADGFCCESACADLCQSCGLAGTEGSCTAYGNRTDPQSECGLTLCNGASACISACAADSDCKGGNYCGSGTCAPKKPDGVSCTATGECQSGVCADGFCCQTACGALCQSCGLAGAQGSCTTFSNRTDPQSECGLTYCNGASACIAACAGDSDCKSGNYCAGGACTARQGNGQACGGANMCGSGNCVDGVCCDSACSGRCDACNLAGSVGSCSPMPAGTVGAPSCSPFVCDGSSVACPAGCTSDAQCAPGLSCADGDCSPVPLGLVVPFAGSGLPPGWLFAEGQVLTRAAYPALFAAIGDSYGAPDGLSFNLPDLRGRFPLGKAAGGTGAVLGERGGALIMGGGTLSLPPLTPAFTVPAVNYSVNGLAAHGHTVSFPTQTFRAGSSTSIQPSTFSLNGTCGSACSNGWTSFTVPSRSASAGSVTPTATLDVATAAFRVVRYVIKVSSSSAVPCGAVWGNAATTAPAGAADANGSPASGDLATCLDAAYAGALPDLRGRFALGRSTSGIGATLNAAGGALDIAHQATRTIPSTGVTVPSVSIAITPPDHVHTSSWVNFGHEPGAVNSSLVAGDSPANSGPRRESAASQTATTNGGGGSSTSDAASGTAPAAVFSPAFRALNQVAFLSASAGLTPGLLAPFAGSTTPPGWLLADGSCVSRTTYGALFSAIGTLHGGCDGVNNFGLPDLRGRFPLGKAASGTGSSLGVAGGALNFQPSVGFGNFTPSFTWAPPPYAFNLPNHTHDANINGGSGADTCCANFTGIPNRGVWSYVSDPAGAQTVSTNTPAGQLVSGTPTGATTGLFPAETPAYVALNFLIKY